MNNIRIKNYVRKHIVSKYLSRCVYCGAKALETGQKHKSQVVDHIIPVSKGGTNEISNLVNACYICNAQKCAMSITEFREWKYRKIHSIHPPRFSEKHIKWVLRHWSKTVYDKEMLVAFFNGVNGVNIYNDLVVGDFVGIRYRFFFERVGWKIGAKA